MNGTRTIIWKSINSKSMVVDTEGSQPDDVQFKLHCEKSVMYLLHLIYIPLLNGPFTYQELDEVVQSIKDRSYIRVCPGLFLVLPTSWLIFFLTIFNFVFYNVCYPFTWCHNKFIILFKSGDRMNCYSYRGISIMNTLAKV